MIESRLLELIEYRMGKTHNNVALAREILAEVSRPESGSVGSVKALDALRVEMMEGQGDASSSTVIDWANRIREAVSLLSTAQPAPSAGSVPSVEELAAMGVIISERKRKERPGLLVIGADYWLEFAKELNSLLLSTAHRGEVGLDDAVSRFLGWRLPENFHPDQGISFTPPTGPYPQWPTGTNLFNATQARAMLRHVLGHTKPKRGADTMTADEYRILCDGIVERIRQYKPEPDGRGAIAFDLDRKDAVDYMLKWLPTPLQPKEVSREVVKSLVVGKIFAPGVTVDQATDAIMDLHIPPAPGVAEAVSREAMEDFCQLAEIITEKRDGSGKYQRIVMNAMMMLYEKGYLNKRNQLVIRQLVSPAPGVAEAVEAQREYIKLLEAELGDVIGIAAAHGWKSSHYEQGIDLRAKIDRALSSLGVKP